MDPPLSPPVRLQAISAMPITQKAMQKQIDMFLEDYQSRTTAAQGTNTAVTVQLQKLANALKADRKKKKTDSKG